MKLSVNFEGASKHSKESGKAKSERGVGQQVFRSRSRQYATNPSESGEPLLDDQEEKGYRSFSGIVSGSVGEHSANGRTPLPKTDALDLPPRRKGEIKTSNKRAKKKVGLKSMEWRCFLASLEPVSQVFVAYLLMSMLYPGIIFDVAPKGFVNIGDAKKNYDGSSPSATTVASKASSWAAGDEQIALTELDTVDSVPLETTYSRWQEDSAFDAPLLSKGREITTREHRSGNDVHSALIHAVADKQPKASGGSPAFTWFQFALIAVWSVFQFVGRTIPLSKRLSVFFTPRKIWLILMLPLIVSVGLVTASASQQVRTRSAKCRFLSY